jgi:hypothetical protein
MVDDNNTKAAANADAKIAAADARSAETAKQTARAQEPARIGPAPGELIGDAYKQHVAVLFDDLCKANDSADPRAAKAAQDTFDKAMVSATRARDAAVARMGDRMKPEGDRPEDDEDYRARLMDDTRIDDRSRRSDILVAEGQVLDDIGFRRYGKMRGKMQGGKFVEVEPDDKQIEAKDAAKPNIGDSKLPDDYLNERAKREPGAKMGQQAGRALGPAWIA